LRQFASDAAHEIRTPLTSLKADLTNALAETDMKRSRAMVVRSLDQVERLEQLSKDLLDLSKIENQTGESLSTKLNLTDLLLRLSEVHASAAEQAGIDFQVALGDETVFVAGNEQQLQRAVSNLLGNAVKFTPSGGVVTLGLERQEDQAVITVRDTGIGIPMEERDLLFNRFHRGRNTHQYPGSGLGLAIARAIVEKYGGQIGLLPAPDQTIFFIRLPII
jgi:signal transduction histidine kinase